MKLDESMDRMGRYDALVESVDAWESASIGEIYRHWRGRPAEGSDRGITMVEFGRLAWRESVDDETSLNQLGEQANRLLQLAATHQFSQSRNPLFSKGHRIAEAIAHTSLALVSCRRGHWDDVRRNLKSAAMRLSLIHI